MRLDLNANEVPKSCDLRFGVQEQQTTIKLAKLNSWGGIERTDTRLPLTDYATLGGPRNNCSSPFPLSKDVNNRLIIWDGGDGDASTLDVDAITSVIDESLANAAASAIDPLIGRPNTKTSDIYGGGGSGGGHTDEVRVVEWSDRPPVLKYDITTLGTIIKEQSQSTAESNLYNCYRRILNKVVELDANTIGFRPLNANGSEVRLASDLRAHIALKAVRRFLEKSTKQTVILCVRCEDRGIYEVLAPLYFPRDQLEERSALWQLPRDIGGDPADAQHPDRQIRIIRNPQHSVMMMRHNNTDDDEADNNSPELEGCGSDLETGLFDFSDLNSNANGIVSQSYEQMQGDLDRQRLLGDRSRSTNEIYTSVVANGLQEIEHQERYENLLLRAQIEDLTEISGIGCLYQSGVDRLGRPVVVFCGKWFPAHNVNLEKALLYLIKLLDPIVKGAYVISYFHTLTSANNYPSLHWLREVYNVLPYKYKKNLKAFYIVHPTFWTKMMTWWFTTFMAPAIKAKVHSLPGVEHLYSAISKDQLEIPAYITEYDMATNGLHYFTPMSTPES